MSYILDTSAFSAYTNNKNPDQNLKPYFSSDSEILVPLIVIAELRAGFMNGTKQQENEYILQRFLDSPNVATLPITDTTTWSYARVYTALRKIGRPMGVNDMWIAALCFEHDLPLLTCDEDFSRVPDLMTVR